MLDQILTEDDAKHLEHQNLQRELEFWRTAFRDYASHPHWCHHSRSSGRWVCNCDLQELLEAVKQVSDKG